MTSAPSWEQLRRDLAPLTGHDVVVHGSVLGDHFTPRSDIDVAVVTQDADSGRNVALWRRIVGTVPDRYDVRVFELLPLPIQVRIAEHHKVVFGDPIALSYHFYRFRRRWDDEGPRYRANQFASFAEKMRLRQRR